MSASKEIIINRPQSHYAEKKDMTKLQRFLGENDTPQNRQVVIDTIVQIAAIEEWGQKAWGRDIHEEVGRTLGTSGELSLVSFLRQRDEGILVRGHDFKLKLADQPIR